jgi:hypothetical protein
MKKRKKKIKIFFPFTFFFSHLRIQQNNLTSDFFLLIHSRSKRLFIYLKSTSVLPLLFIFFRSVPTALPPLTYIEGIIHIYSTRACKKKSSILEKKGHRKDMISKSTTNGWYVFVLSAGGWKKKKYDEQSLRGVVGCCHFWWRFCLVFLVYSFILCKNINHTLASLVTGGNIL